MADSVTSAELLRGASTEELREAAGYFESRGRPGYGSLDLLAAAALSLIAEGRKSGEPVFSPLEAAIDACHTMAGWTDSAVRAYEYQEAETWLRALAGGSP